MLRHEWLQNVETCRQGKKNNTWSGREIRVPSWPVNGHQPD